MIMWCQQSPVDFYAHSTILLRISSQLDEIKKSKRRKERREVDACDFNDRNRSDNASKICKFSIIFTLKLQFSYPFLALSVLSYFHFYRLSVRSDYYAPRFSTLFRCKQDMREYEYSFKKFPSSEAHGDW